ncbi:MAG: hypothetical protein ACREQ5_08300 [Candidatus Dormibacteria bacterium]
MDNTLDYRAPENRQTGFDAFYEYHCQTLESGTDLSTERWMNDHNKADFEARVATAFWHATVHHSASNIVLTHVIPKLDQDGLDRLADFYTEEHTRRQRLKFANDCKSTRINFHKLLLGVGMAIRPYGTLGKAVVAQLQQDDPTSNYQQLMTWLLDIPYLRGRMTSWQFAEGLHRHADLPILPNKIGFATGGANGIYEGWCLANNVLANANDPLPKNNYASLERQALKYVKEHPWKHSTLFNLETCLCNYHGQWIGNRYAGNYIDEQHDLIRNQKDKWPEYKVIFDLAWKARAAVFPPELVYELHNPPGEAEKSSWMRSFKDYGRMIRVEAWHNNQPQVWDELDIVMDTSDGLMEFME